MRAAASVEKVNLTVQKLAESNEHQLSYTIKLGSTGDEDDQTCDTVVKAQA
jgi:hypothetical protein